MASLPSIESVIAQLAGFGLVLPPGRVRLDAYGDSEALSEELLELIGSGHKRAGTSLLWAMEANAEQLPAVGDIEVVLDFNNLPVFVTRILEAEVLPFCDVSARYAAIEGEGDGSLEYWREAHWAFFSRDCARIGRSPTQEMPVVCCVIEVLNRVRHERGAYP